MCFPYVAIRSGLRSLENKSELPFTVIKDVKNLVSIPRSYIDESISIATCVLHLLRKLAPFCSKNLNANIWKFGFQCLDFFLGWQFQDSLILKSPQNVIGCGTLSAFAVPDVWL